jgi:uncharacterized membrane protein (UPF0136 family)
MISEETLPNWWSCLISSCFLGFAYFSCDCWLRKANLRSHQAFWIWFFILALLTVQYSLTFSVIYKLVPIPGTAQSTLASWGALLYPSLLLAALFCLTARSTPIIDLEEMFTENGRAFFLVLILLTCWGGLETTYIYRLNDSISVENGLRLVGLSICLANILYIKRRDTINQLAGASLILILVFFALRYVHITKADKIPPSASLSPENCLTH